VRKPFDYSWIVLVVAIVVVIFAYKPVMNSIQKARQPKEGSDYLVGKEIFYNPSEWGPENRSCAMCHKKDYELSPNHTEVEMEDFTYVELKDIKGKFGIGVIGNPDRLLSQVNRCLGSPERINGGKINFANRKWQPLLAYLVRQ
jgi:hypothetical protein